MGFYYIDGAFLNTIAIDYCPIHLTGQNQTYPGQKQIVCDSKNQKMLSIPKKTISSHFHKQKWTFWP